VHGLEDRTVSNRAYRLSASETSAPGGIRLTSNDTIPTGTVNSEIGKTALKLPLPPRITDTT
jgi:hypothetical protein